MPNQEYSVIPGTKVMDKFYKCLMIFIITISAIIIIVSSIVLKQHIDKNNEIRESLKVDDETQQNHHKEYIRERVNIDENYNYLLIMHLLQDIFNSVEDKISRIKECRKIVDNIDKGKTLSEESLQLIRTLIPPPSLKLPHDVKTFPSEATEPTTLTFDSGSIAQMERNCFSDDFIYQNDGSIKINKPGRYFVSSTLLFGCHGAAASRVSHVVHYFNPNYEVSQPLMINEFQLCAPKHGDTSESKQGGVYQLKKDSTITVKVSFTEAVKLIHDQQALEDSANIVITYLGKIYPEL